MTRSPLLRAVPLALVVAVLALSIGAAQAPVANAATCDSPTISGTPRVGNTLTGTSGSNCSPLVTSSVDLQWYRCDNQGDNPSSCTTLEFGSSASPPLSVNHDLVQADVGKFLKLVQTVHDATLLPDTTTEAVSGQIKGTPPTAAFSASPNPALVNHQVSFNGSGSTDPDGQALTYVWHWGDGTADTSTSSATVSHTYRRPGIKTIALHVVDTDGDPSPTVSHQVRVKGPPSASFVLTPGSPQVGQDVTFTSTSTDPDGDALTYAWDLDGDGAFDDGTAKQVHFTYSAPRSYSVSLKVTSVDGTKTVFRTVEVVAAPGGKKPKRKLKLLRPFPKVGIGGFVTGRGVFLTLLSVRAPRGSKVMIKCRGRGCPRRTTRKRIGRRKRASFRSFRRRFRPGARIRVYVWKKNRIGKLTTFRIRRNRAPARSDRCLNPNTLRATRCP